MACSAQIGIDILTAVETAKEAEQVQQVLIGETPQLLPNLLDTCNADAVKRRRITGI
jgi:hypothetical protein